MAGVALLVGASIAGTWLGTSGGSGTASPVEVTTQPVTVSTGTIKQAVAASGTVAPASQADLSFAVSGKVSAVAATVGQSVSAGQVLATVDPTALQYQLSAAQETLAADQSRLSADQGDGASTSQIDSDQAAVTSAQAQVSAAETNLSDASLTSPIAGTVASVNLVAGQEVAGSGSGANGGIAGAGASSASSASSTSSASSAEVVVVATRSYLVDTTVDDTEVGEVEVGDQATIVPTGSTATFYGTVSSVGLVAESGGSTTSSSVAAFPVVIAVTGTPSGLYSGTTATVSIIVKQLDDVVEVPTAAISFVNGQPTVTKLVGGRHVSQAVATGAAAGGFTQVTAGLNSGDVILERVVKFNGASITGGRSIFGAGGGRTFRGGGGGLGGPGAFGGGG